MPRDEGRRPAGGGRWWWLVVALLALVVVAILVRGGGDPAPPREQAPATPSLEPAPPGDEVERGTFRVGDEPVEGAEPLSERAGAPVVGREVPVVAVRATGVYVVGGADARILLVAPPDAEAAAEERDLVTFTGTLRRLADDERAAAAARDDPDVGGQGVYVAVEGLTARRP